MVVAVIVVVVVVVAEASDLWAGAASIEKTPLLRGCPSSPPHHQLAGAKTAD